MAKHNRTGRSKGGPPFVQLFHHVLASEAWLASKPLDRAVVVQLARRYNGSNNGRLGMSVRDAAEECCADKDACGAAFKRLEERGFIECVLESGFSFKLKRAREWRLTWLRCDVTNTPPSRAYQRWTVPKIRTAAEREEQEGSDEKKIHGPERARLQSPPKGQPDPRRDRLVRREGTNLAPSATSLVPPPRTHIDLTHRPDGTGGRVEPKPNSACLGVSVATERSVVSASQTSLDDDSAAFD